MARPHETNVSRSVFLRTITTQNLKKIDSQLDRAMGKKLYLGNRSADLDEKKIEKSTFKKSKFGSNVIFLALFWRSFILN